MSAIGFGFAVERVADPRGERLKRGMTGKFLPFE
jgi:cyanate lyase